MAELIPDARGSRSDSPRDFDPYRNRKARDLRNLLSRAFMQALDAMEQGPFEALVPGFMDQARTPPFESWLNDRICRYRKAFSEIQDRRIADKLRQALVLWNHGLFFEVHERLEEVWQQSSGEYREAMKGFIQAAGVFIHLEFGRTGPARGISEKARTLLAGYGRFLPINVEDLLLALKEDPPPPPRLREIP